MHAQVSERRAGAHGIFHRLFGERRETRVARAGHESVRRQYAMLGMPRACETFHSDELLAFEVDFGLVPEFDPVICDGIVEHDAGGYGRRHAELQLMDDLLDRSAVEWLFNAGQHTE